MRTSALIAVALLVFAIVLGLYYFRSVPAPSSLGTEGSSPTQVSSTADAAAFLDLVERDDVTAARQMLEQSPQLAKTREYGRGETALHHAQSIDMAELLIEFGADPAARDRDTNGTPARWATSEWRTDLRQYLETKAPPEDDLPYLVATGRKDRLAQALTKAPENMDVRTDSGDVLGGGRHLLHIAATYGQAEAAQLLLESGADACVDGGWNDTQPLENAAWAGYPDVVKVLVKSGADLEDTDQQNNHTALWYAAITGRTEVVRILLDAGAKIEDGMIAAVEGCKTDPYFGRELPAASEYDAVIALLRQHGGK